MADSIFSKLVGQWRNHPGAPLAALLAHLRAVYQIHQAHHWQTRGQAYYGDHLLFQRLYETVVPEIDSVAERAVGTGGVELVDAAVQAQQTGMVVAALTAPESAGPYVRVGSRQTPSGYVDTSLAAEASLLAALDDVLTRTKLSQGTQNLLQGIADTHEGNVYLLQQRMTQG